MPALVQAFIYPYYLNNSFIYCLLRLPSFLSFFFPYK
jgi:hypothetical protein